MEQDVFVAEVMPTLQTFADLVQLDQYQVQIKILVNVQLDQYLILIVWDAFQFINVKITLLDLSKAVFTDANVMLIFMQMETIVFIVQLQPYGIQVHYHVIAQM